MTNGRKVEIENSSLVLDDFFKVKAARLRFERFDGSMSETVRRLSLERGDAVGVLIYHKDQQHYVLAEQFRFPTVRDDQDGWMLEVVAGMIDGDEPPEHAARREVREEIGYELTALTPISTFYVSPGGSSERIFLFYGEIADSSRVGEGGGLASENEDIRMRHFTQEELERALDAGALSDAKTVIAAMWTRRQR